MSYEHLKASWRAEVEAIVRSELSKMEAEIARMHHQVEQSFTHLLSQSAARLAAVSQDPAIAGFTERLLTHLAALAPAPVAPPEEAPVGTQVQSAAEGPPPETPPPSPAVDLQTLYAYLTELQSQPTQAEVLNLLITRALDYAPRVALFVIKSGNMVAWAERGFEAAGVSLRGLNIPLQAQTTLLAAVEHQNAVLDSPYAYAANQVILDRLGSAPEVMVGIPLLVRHKAAAVLYADTGDQPATQLVLPPLQILVNTAGLTVELLNARSRLATASTTSGDRTTQAMPVPAVESTTPPPSETTPAETAPAETAPSGVTAPPNITPEAAAPATTQVTTPVTTPAPAEMSAPPATAVSEMPAEQPFRAVGDTALPSAAPMATGGGDGRATMETPASDIAAPPMEPVFEPQPLPPVVPPGPVVQEAVKPMGLVETSTIPPAETYPSPAQFLPTAEPAVPSPDSQSLQATPAETESPTNGFSVQPLTPTPPPSPPSKPAAALPTPPKPTTEEEAKAHNDARRFARLLVSEIKLYNEAKVIEGRLNCDLYDRLKEDIDRSRQMYDKRVNPIVAAKFDYFYDELVSLLAEGDKSRLGADCPGPVLLQPE